MIANLKFINWFFTFFRSLGSYGDSR